MISDQTLIKPNVFNVKLKPSLVYKDEIRLFFDFKIKIKPKQYAVIRVNLPIILN